MGGRKGSERDWEDLQTEVVLGQSQFYGKKCLESFSWACTTCGELPQATALMAANDVAGLAFVVLIMTVRCTSATTIMEL